MENDWDVGFVWASQCNSVTLSLPVCFVVFNIHPHPAHLSFVHSLSLSLTPTRFNHLFLLTLLYSTYTNTPYVYFYALRLQVLILPLRYPHQQLLPTRLAPKGRLALLINTHPHLQHPQTTTSPRRPIGQRSHGARRARADSRVPDDTRDHSGSRSIYGPEYSNVSAPAAVEADGTGGTER